MERDKLSVWFGVVWGVSGLDLDLCVGFGGVGGGLEGWGGVMFV